MHVWSKQKKNFDAHHGSQKVPVIQPGDSVWVAYTQSQENIIDHTNIRSYALQNTQGSYWRNNHDIAVTPGQEMREMSYPSQDMIENLTPCNVESQKPVTNAGSADQNSDHTKIYFTR